MFSLICAWTNSWANNWDVGDLRCHRAHYDIIVMAPRQILLKYIDIRKSCPLTPYICFTYNHSTPFVALYDIQCGILNLHSSMVSFIYYSIRTRVVFDKEMYSGMLANTMSWQGTMAKVYSCHNSRTFFWHKQICELLSNACMLLVPSCFFVHVPDNKTALTTDEYQCTFFQRNDITNTHHHNAAKEHTLWSVSSICAVWCLTYLSVLVPWQRMTAKCQW